MTEIDLKSYSGKRVLVTGSAGFKGKHLVEALTSLGATVRGFDIRNSAFKDVRGSAMVDRAVREFDPEVIFHLAAQAFVPVGYAAPLRTIETNVLGTANLLEAVRQADRACAVVVVTTDKVYGETGGQAAKETDRMHAECPYSASKIMAETIVETYRESFFGPEAPGIAVATARAGNVIGPGDWGQGRLVPNAFRALKQGKPVPVYHPEAIRPWQFVSDVIRGYLLLGAALLGPDREEFTGAWNFGPDEHHTVLEVVQGVCEAWGDGARWELTPQELHEVSELRIDSSSARTYLGWAPRYSLRKAIEATVAWGKRGEFSP